MADEIEPQAANIVTVAKDEPYPTGSPYVLDLARVHTPQERTAGPIGTYNAAYERQKIQNLAAGGMVSGGAAGT